MACENPEQNRLSTEEALTKRFAIAGEERLLGEDPSDGACQSPPRDQREGIVQPDHGGRAIQTAFAEGSCSCQKSPSGLQRRLSRRAVENGQDPTESSWAPNVRSQDRRGSIATP